MQSDSTSRASRVMETAAFDDRKRTVRTHFTQKVFSLYFEIGFVLKTVYPYRNNITNYSRSDPSNVYRDPFTGLLDRA